VVVLIRQPATTITLDYRGGQSGPLEVAGKGALTVIGPMQQAVAGVVRPVGAFFTGLIHIASLESENCRLRSEVQSQRILIAQAGEACSPARTPSFASSTGSAAARPEGRARDRHRAEPRTSSGRSPSTRVL
jgi:hypothetical protein